MREYYKIIAWSDCPFCDEAKKLMVKEKKQFIYCVIDESPELLKMLKSKHCWETVPMVFHYKLSDEGSWKGEFIGGYSDTEKQLKDD